MRQLIYPKTYAVILKHEILASKASYWSGVMDLPEYLTPSEYELRKYRPGKRRWHYQGFRLTLMTLATQEEVILDQTQITYDGHRWRKIVAGVTIKMHKKPGDQRWRFRLRGE